MCRSKHVEPSVNSGIINSITSCILLVFLLSHTKMHGSMNIKSINFLSENRALYKMMWKNILHPDRPQMTIWYMRIPCWIHKATNTNLEYVTLIAFPLQQAFHKRAPMLRYTYSACVVILSLDGCERYTSCTLHVL